VLGGDAHGVDLRYSRPYIRRGWSMSGPGVIRTARSRAEFWGSSNTAVHHQLHEFIHVLHQWASGRLTYIRWFQAGGPNYDPLTGNPYEIAADSAATSLVEPYNRCFQSLGGP